MRPHSFTATASRYSAAHMHFLSSKLVYMSPVRLPCLSPLRLTLGRPYIFGCLATTNYAPNMQLWWASLQQHVPMQILFAFLADCTIGSCLWHTVSFWHTMSSVCCLSVCLSSVTFCIVAKRYVRAKNFLKEWIGNQGQKVDFLGRRHISTSGFASTATMTAVFALFLPDEAASS